MKELKTLLIVDDSRITRDIISKLAKTSCPELNIVTAASAEEALEKTKDIQFEAATIDYNMPGIDGLALATQLQVTHPHARLALLTANIQDAIIRRVQDAGIAFIPKPVSEAKVRNFIVLESTE